MYVLIMKVCENRQQFCFTQSFGCEKKSTYIEMGASMFIGNSITMKRLVNVETRILEKFVALVTINSQQTFILRHRKQFQ